MLIKLSLLAVVFLLPACSSTGVLTSVTPDAPIAGTVTRGFMQPYHIEVILDGKAYRGKWRREAAAEHPEANSYLHKRHVGRVRSTLSADDGTQLACTWLVHGQEGEGSCIAPDKREYGLSVR